MEDSVVVKDKTVCANMNLPQQHRTDLSVDNFQMYRLLHRIQCTGELWRIVYTSWGKRADVETTVFSRAMANFGKLFPLAADLVTTFQFEQNFLHYLPVHCWRSLRCFNSWKPDEDVHLLQIPLNEARLFCFQPYRLQDRLFQEYSTEVEWSIFVQLFYVPIISTPL